MNPKNAKIYHIENPQKQTFFSDFVPDYILVLPTQAVSWTEPTGKKCYRMTVVSICGYKADGSVHSRTRDYVLTSQADLKKVCSHLNASLKMCDAKEISIDTIPELVYKEMQKKLIKNNYLLKTPNVFDILMEEIKCPQE